MLGDTVRGKVIHYEQGYYHWMEKLGEQLKEVTCWRGADDKRGEDSLPSKSGDAKQILIYLNRLTEDQEVCFNLLNSRLEIKGKIGLLSLLPSIYHEVSGSCKKFESDWFVDIMSFLVNSVPEKSGHAGAVSFRVHPL
ncbi:MAG TPA: hypothetical protein EYG21_04885 [Nitrospinaceae bacterium]|nr:hypothetical protein [Nitrospinaceae bacterium]